MLRPAELQERLGASWFAIKLYTEKGERYNDERPLAHVFPTSINLGSLSGFGATVYGLTALAKYALETSPTARDVLVQATRHKYDVKPLPATPYRPALSSQNRAWSLELGMSVDQRHEDSLSTAYVRLQSNKMVFPHQKYLDRTPTALVEGASVTFDVAGLLRKPFSGVDDHVTIDKAEKNTTSAQDTIDYLTNEMYKAIFGVRFDSAVALVDALRDALAARFNSTALGTYLELANIEVTISGGSGERMVSNKAYSSLETARTAPLVTVPDTGPGVVVGPESPPIVLDSTYWNGRPLSL